MRTRRWVVTALTMVLAVVVAGLVWTREPPAPPPVPDGAADPGAPHRPRERIVNMQPLLTARRLTALARTPEEQELARQAVRIADHAVDLAMADSIRRIAEDPPPPTPEVRALAEAKQKAQAALDAARRRVEELDSSVVVAGGPEQQHREELRSLALAQQELAQDELDEAAERLARAGGDPQAQIEKLKAAYEAAQKEPPPPPLDLPAAGAATPASILGRLRVWSALGEKRAAVEGARREALARAQATSSRMERLAARIRKAEAALPDPAGANRAQAAATGESAVDSLHKAARDRRRLTALGKRLQDQQELAEVYADWVERVDGQVRGALHQVLVAVLWLLAVGAAALAASVLVDRALPSHAEESARQGTLRMVSRLTIQAVGVLAALFIVFGAPRETTTIVGLAGAGLTVALKDFIVAFFGWFVLMGRNGLRVGDWVEIEGVGGEVAEIGLFHTVLLETGSSGEAGHPTGRRVSFVNSFAIERHFFNFSTSGQWMWDELRLVVPLGKDPYPVIDSVQKLVEQETEANAQLAEQEWRKTTRYRVRTFSAVPAINVVPTGGGVELEVRYITRAYERHATRRRLSQAIVELMHGKRAEAVPAAGTDAA